MKKIYAEVGSNATQIGRENPDGYVEVSEMRPEGEYICSAIDENNGEWIPGLTSSQAKLKGVLFDGVLCSATSTDMFGLNSVKDYILAGNNSRFYFENGNDVLLTAANFAAFEAIWVPFRQSFFPTE